MRALQCAQTQCLEEERRMSGIIAAAVVAHVPTLGRAEITPDFQQTLVQGEREMGVAVRRALKPDLWIVVSAHWVATFDWVTTCQSVHEGHCVADEAPNLIPGLPYRYRGDADFAGTLVEALNAAGVPSSRNDSTHYAWDYGTYVPLSHIDPGAETAVVSLPSVLMSDHAECIKAGEVIHATAKRLDRRAVFVASTAFAHVLARGRQNWPAPERMAADRAFIDQLRGGQIDAAIGELGDYSRKVGAEMGGRPLATLLGVARSMTAERGPLVGRQYGEYAQSSGSGNAVLLMSDPATLASVH
jgi:3,4-dihydroxyphenylacetate 2,3-dioxygenase